MSDDHLAHQAFEELYGKLPARAMHVRYHGRLQGLNATVQQSAFSTTFRLSHAFKSCEDEVKLGVMQYLLNRINKTKVKSEHIDFYHSFLKRMSDLAPVTDVEPQLKESFDRVNEKYFAGMMSMPNLVWGRRSTTLLGTYTYATDTIMISAVLRDAPFMLLDSVMHHEMLHKKHKFSCSTTRTHSHTAAFRRDEALFEDKQIEEKLTRFLRGARRQNVVLEQQPSSFFERVMGWK